MPSGTANGMKVCPRCKQELPLAAFTPRSTDPTRVRSYCKPCTLDYNREYLQAKPRHGLSKEALEELLEKHDHRCAICNRQDELVIDHDHNCCKGGYSCGQCVRGVLCRSCNLMLGYAGDNVELLASAAAYLMSHER